LLLSTNKRTKNKFLKNNKGLIYIIANKEDNKCFFVLKRKGLVIITQIKADKKQLFDSILRNVYIISKEEDKLLFIWLTGYYY